MSAKTTFTAPEQVALYLQKLDHPLKKVVEALRLIVIETDARLEEHIKWNSVSFYYTGEMKPFDPKEYKRDLVVFNVHKKDYVLLVFPTGAGIKDTSGLLAGKFTDGRKTIQFSSLEEVLVKKLDLQKIIRAWIEQLE